MIDLSVSERKIGGNEVIVPQGEITVLNIEPFKSAVGRLQSTDGDVIVDLREVSYIDSAGIEQLVIARSIAVGADHRLIVLVKPGSQPEHVLDAIAIRTFATMTTDPGEAGLE